MEWITIVFIILALILAIIIYRRGASNQFKNILIDEFSYKGGNLRIKNLKIHPRSRSEASVVGYLEGITGESFPTSFPRWLTWKGRRLELDGYNEKLGIALEFSGPLHTKWNPTFESYPDYYERCVRDVVKRRLCKKHKVYLIVVDCSLPSKHWRNYVLSRLHDAGFIKDKPVEYIDEQTPEPYRNEILEKNLGIANDMAIAIKI